MPSFIIRMLDSLASNATDASSPEQRLIPTLQADMILRSAEDLVCEPHDLEDIRIRYRRLVALDVDDVPRSPDVDAFGALPDTHLAPIA